jgi:hypothetical protein
MLTQQVDGSSEHYPGKNPLNLDENLAVNIEKFILVSQHKY